MLFPKASLWAASQHQRCALKKAIRAPTPLNCVMTLSNGRWNGPLLRNPSPAAPYSGDIPTGRRIRYQNPFEGLAGSHEPASRIIGYSAEQARHDNEYPTCRHGDRKRRIQALLIGDLFGIVGLFRRGSTPWNTDSPTQLGSQRTQLPGRFRSS